jgi:triosephosphate isomerase (TIM)
MSHEKLIVGNWKMNGTISETLKQVTALQKKLGKTEGIDVVLAPPFTALYSASIALQDSSIKLAGQNVHWEADGAYTGEIAPLFLKDCGCTYVIIGHSERRRFFHETDDQLNKKVLAALSNDLIPIFCIGESLEEREAGHTFECLEAQLKFGLKDLHVHDFEEFAIAYEPVWAIGTGENATPSQIQEVHSWVRDAVTKMLDAPTSNKMSLLYGGSVKPNNAQDILAVDEVDGLLVGGASLNAEDFIAIIRSA